MMETGERSELIREVNRLNIKFLCFKLGQPRRKVIYPSYFKNVLSNTSCVYN
jgi:hypothetical protein